LSIFFAAFCIAAGQPAYAQVRAQIQGGGSFCYYCWGPSLTVRYAPGLDATGLTGTFLTPVWIAKPPLFHEYRLITTRKAIPPVFESGSYKIESSIIGPLMSMHNVLASHGWIPMQAVNASEFIEVPGMERPKKWQRSVIGWPRLPELSEPEPASIYHCNASWGIITVSPKPLSLPPTGFETYSFDLTTESQSVHAMQAAQRSWLKANLTTRPTPGQPTDKF
jgi:hypothetical protein